MSVMAAIRKREGLQAEIARRCKVSKQAVNKWRRVPLSHAKIVAEVTGLAVADLRAEHRTADSEKRQRQEAAWKIPREEIGIGASDGSKSMKTRLRPTGTRATRPAKSRSG